MKVEDAKETTMHVGETLTYTHIHARAHAHTHHAAYINIICNYLS